MVIELFVRIARNGINLGATFKSTLDTTVKSCGMADVLYPASSRLHYIMTNKVKMYWSLKVLRFTAVSHVIITINSVLLTLFDWSIILL